jgi:hypothetical protein
MESSFFDIIFPCQSITLLIPLNAWSLVRDSDALMAKAEGIRIVSAWQRSGLPVANVSAFRAGAFVRYLGHDDRDHLKAEMERVGRGRKVGGFDD